MGEFNSDDHYIYYSGQESLRRNGVALTVNKRVQNAVLGCNLKNSRMISVHFQGKPFNITVVQADPSWDSDSELQVAAGHSWEPHLSRLPTQKTLLTLRNSANSLKQH